MKTFRGSFMRSCGALAGMLASSVPGNAGAADAYTMRLSHSIADSSSEGIAARRFAAAVERRSNGQLKVEVYPSNSLVKEQEAIDGLTSGVIDFAIAATPFLERLFPAFQVFDTPFLFKNLGALYRVLDGSIGEEIFALLDPKGIVGLGWGDNGFQQLETAPKAVVVPEDMKSLRMRVAGGAIGVAMFQAMGALPVAVDASEVVAALTLHTIDGTGVSISGFTSNKWYTACKHVAMTNHVPSVNPVLGSKRKIEALPAPLQRIVREEAKAIVPYWRGLTGPKDTADIETLKQNGVSFTEVQYAAFRKAMDPVFGVVQSKVGGTFLERIGRVANSA